MTESTSLTAQQLQSEIAALQQAIAALAALPDAQRPLLARLADKEHQLAAIQLQTGGVSLGQGNIIGQMGDAVAGDKIAGDQVLRDKIVNQFFGGAPGERGETLLTAYLDWLARHCDQMRLTRLRERRQTGSESATAPELRLQDVYTNLTTNGPEVVIYQRRRAARQVQRLRQWLSNHPHGSDDVDPPCVRTLRFATKERLAALSTPGHELDPNDQQTPVAYAITRPELATEAIAGHARLVLLGEPGSGKSTALRYLALLLAWRLRGKAVSIPGWATGDMPIPIICPLGQVAAALPRYGDDAYTALREVLGDILEDSQMSRAGLHAYLTPALRAGGVLLLCDGLDEVPVGAGNAGPRARIARAVAQLAENSAARIVVTSRVKPYQEAADWQLPAGWMVRTIQPLAFGQVRTFVQAWYRALSVAEPDIDIDRAAARAEQLIVQVSRFPHLRALVDSPLLLTMLALLHANREGEIPRDRARLYHECVQLLLERWEPVRTPELPERVSALHELLLHLPRLDLDKLRDVIHRLAHQAHANPPGDDGRGQLDRYRLLGQLTEFFQQIGSINAADDAQLFLRVVREEAGLLLARDDESAYTFPHLTFQEYLAACWLADQRHMADLAYRVWCGDDRERWRQVLLLMIGQLRLKGQKDVERDAVPWLLKLADSGLSTGPKPATQRRRDAVLAALSYDEMGGRVALATSMPALSAHLMAQLRAAIVDLLAVPDPAILSADRVAAAHVLGALGDPRLGIGSLDPQWCKIPAGSFLLGSNDSDTQAFEGEKPQRTVNLPGFRIARYPITNAQWQYFINAGGYREQPYWSAMGWEEKSRNGWIQPALWDDPGFNGSNQPVVGISWYEATAFCRWLSVELGYAVRLPSEAEWEKAARGTDGRIYPWGDDWDAARANTSESGIGTTTPVGCFPDGASPYGALDMSGNVWEWTATPWMSNYRQSDGTARETEDGERFVLRGGAWCLIRGFARCAYRDSLSPATRSYFLGVRVVAALTRDG